MKKGWEYTTLAEACNIEYGTRVVQKRDGGTIYPVYGGGGATFRIDTYNRENRLVVGRFAMSAQCTRYVSGKFFLNDSGLTVSPKKESGLSQRLLDVILLASNDLIYSFGRGSAQRNLNTDEFKKMPISYPRTLPEQEEIVRYLDAAFAKIDELKKIAEQQLSESKALFQKALTEYLSPKKGWEQKKLGELTSKIGSGATPKGGKRIYLDEGVSLIRSMNVLYNAFKYQDLAHIDDISAKQLSGVEIFEKDVLFNITGASIARCCIVPSNIIPARVNQHVCILRPLEQIIPQFLCYTMISPLHQRELLQIGESASTRQALTKADLENHSIPLPPLPEQQAIVAKLDTISAHCRQLEENYRQTIALCDDLKQKILKQVFEE